MRVNTVAGALAAAALSACLVACEPASDPADDPVYADNVVLVSGSVASATTWAAGKVYYLDSAVYVESGATLTIQAGAIVKFGTEGLLDVSGGTLVANGTADSRIVFTSIRDLVGGDSVLNDGATDPAKGDWNYVWANVGSSGNVLRYCEFRYAGRNAKAALFVDGASTVDNCVFHDNLCGLPQAATEEAALDARNTVAATVVTNNLFYGNIWPLALPANYSLGASNSFSYDHDANPATAALANVHQAIFLENKGGAITGNVAWSETEVPLCVFNDETILVESGGSLTVASGAAVKFSGVNSGISVDASATFSGSGALFSSYRDDAVMGDTNADGSASSPGAGDWAGIYLDASGDYVTSGVWYAANGS